MGSEVLGVFLRVEVPRGFGSGFAKGLGFRVLAFHRFEGLGFRVQGLGFRPLGFRVLAFHRFEGPKSYLKHRTLHPKP